MKTLIIKISSILLLINVIGAGCKKEDTLPPATQDGLNTLGMMVNGIIWKPHAPITFDGVPALYLKYSTQTKQLIIKARNANQNEKVIFFVEKVRSIGFYNFSSRDNIRAQDTSCHLCIGCTDSTTFMDQNGCLKPFKLIDSINSLMQITKLDTLGKIVSGTFSLILKNSDNKIVSINDGRFDLQFDLQY
jgi:hypothetical protein